MLSFEVFLKSRQTSDDFACDALRGFPDAVTWPVISDLLAKKRACPHAVETVLRLWHDYQEFVNARRTGENEDGRIACSCARLQSEETPEKPRSALSAAYLRYKIVEFLQPHPSYKFDDGFQPQSIIGCAIECDQSAPKPPAEVEGNALIAVLTELVESGEVIFTPYEPANGDFMLGLPENLGKRDAAYEERKWLIVEGAAKCGLRAKWNEDGTGWLEFPGGALARPAGPVWDLLSYLNNAPVHVAEMPQLLN